MHKPSLAIVVALLGTSVPNAFAATVERSEVSLSASRCQPALPAFDGAIRKRPLAMQNESSNATAFITCAFDGVGGDVRSRSRIEIRISNALPASPPGTFEFTTVSCTLVDAGSNFAAPVYITKSGLYGAAASGPITFTAADNGGQPFLYAAVSCGIPPSFGIQSADSTFAEEIGS